MEVEREWNQCRFCFLHTEDYINILEPSSLTLAVIEALKLYFSDEVKSFQKFNQMNSYATMRLMIQVSETDSLPKIVCHQCCDKVREFHKFAKQVVASRHIYLQQHLNNCVKQEMEDVQGVDGSLFLCIDCFSYDLFEMAFFRFQHSR